MLLSIIQFVFEGHVLRARRLPQDSFCLEFNGKAVAVISVRLDIPDVFRNLFRPDATQRRQLHIAPLLCLVVESAEVNQPKILSPIVQAVFTDVLDGFLGARL